MNFTGWTHTLGDCVCESHANLGFNCRCPKSWAFGGVDQKVVERDAHVGICRNRILRTSGGKGISIEQKTAPGGFSLAGGLEAGEDAARGLRRERPVVQLRRPPPGAFGPKPKIGFGPLRFFAGSASLKPQVRMPPLWSAQKTWAELLRAWAARCQSFGDGINRMPIPFDTQGPSCS